MPPFNITPTTESGKNRSHRRFAVSLILLTVTTAIAVIAAPRQFVIGDFSAVSSQGDLPKEWEPLLFQDIDNHTRYRLEQEEGHGVIKAESSGGASGLIRKVNIDLAQYPFISWRWKIKNVLQKGDVASKSGDDYPARIYITFAYDPDNAGLWEKMKFNSIKLIYGDYPPAAAISYIWANKADKGMMTPNAYTDRVMMFVVESGEAKAGQWLHEKRNILEDYRLAFQADPPPISGVAIMTDTDNTGETATAWYGDIILTAKDKDTR